MNTAMVWLLLTMPNDLTSYAAQAHAHVVERFQSAAECQRVAAILNNAGPGGWRLRTLCVQATIVVGKA